MSTVKKINYFTPDQFNYFESWLEDMAGKGLFLKEQKNDICKFEVGEPSKRKYRVFPESIDNISREECFMYEEAGWEYIPSKGQSVFCNENPDATELFTDADSWRKRTKKYRTGRIIRSLLLLIFWVLYTAYLFLKDRINMDFSLVHSLDINIFYAVTALLCILLLMCTLVCEIKGFLEFLRTIRKDTVEHNLPYRKAMNRGKFSYACMLAIFVCAAVTLVYSWNDGALGTKASLAYENPDLVRFRELDESTWNKYYNLIKSKEESGEYHVNYCVRSERTFIRKSASEEFYLSRCIAGPEDEDGPEYETIEDYTVWCSEFKDSETAEKYIEEEIACDTSLAFDPEGFYKSNRDYDAFWYNDPAKEKKPEDIAIDCSGVDYAGYYSESDAFIAAEQNLYLRKGTKLIEVHYTGNKNILDNLDIFISKLQ